MESKRLIYKFYVGADFDNGMYFPVDVRKK